MIPQRRAVLTGLGSLIISAPAIVRASSLMPVKVMELTTVALGSDEINSYGERPWAGFIERLGYHAMENVLKVGWTPERAKLFYGGISESTMRGKVAYAKRYGFLKSSAEAEVCSVKAAL